VIYTVGFLFGSLEYLMQLFCRTFGFSNRFAPLNGILLYLILIFMLLNISLFQYNKKIFYSLWKSIPITRVLHFYGMFIYGFIISDGIFSVRSLMDLFSLVTSFLVILCSGIFSLIINDISDLQIDRISNKNRPLVKKNVSLQEYKIIAVICLVLSFIFGFYTRDSINGLITTLFILIFIIQYSLYSLKPFRLKRIPVLSKMLISSNSLIIVVYGYYYKGGDLSAFPHYLTGYILIFFTLAINFIDIKDYSGDKKCGIKTLPVLLGLEKSKKVISIFVFIAFAAYPVLSGIYWLLPFSVLLGIIEIFLVNKKDYREWKVFCIYLFALYSIIIYKAIF
jgi:4-hydroxybenzoate polyprenyltransferase